MADSGTGLLSHSRLAKPQGHKKESKRRSAAESAKYLSHSLHVIVPYGGHGFNGLNGLDCIDNLILNFIDRGTTAGVGYFVCQLYWQKRFYVEAAGVE